MACTQDKLGGGAWSRAGGARDHRVMFAELFNDKAAGAHDKGGLQVPAGVIPAPATPTGA